MQTDLNFDGSRCTVASDRAIVKTRILQSRFRSIGDFNGFVQGAANETLDKRGGSGRCVGEDNTYTH